MKSMSGRSMSTKLLRMYLSNREWPFLRLFDCFRLPTITVIVRYMISEIDDAQCSMQRRRSLTSILIIYVFTKVPHCMEAT